MTVRVNSDMISTPVLTGPVRPTAGPVSNAALKSVGKFRSLFAAIALAILGAVATALLPASAEAGPLAVQTVIYGIGEDQNIYSIDPVTGGVTGTTSTASLSLSGSLANAFALDRTKAQIYFMGNSTVTGSNNLYFYDTTSGSLGLAATAAQLGVLAMQRNAAFHDNKYWWIGISDNKLYSAAFNYVGGLPSGVASTGTFSITGVTGPALNPNDIAIDPITQTLYGSDTITSNGGSGEFFSISLANLGAPLPYQKLYDQPIVSGTQVGVQLAYNDDFSTLYGQNFNTGAWYTVSTGTGGTFTATGGVTTDPNLHMRDLAGGVQAVPEPGTLALAGSGIVIAGFMVYRDRSRRRRHRDGLTKVTG